MGGGGSHFYGVISQKIFNLSEDGFPYHVIVGDVNVSVADPTELNVKGDIVVTSDVPLDLYLFKRPIWGALGPCHCLVHVSHLLQRMKM